MENIAGNKSTNMDDPTHNADTETQSLEPNAPVGNHSAAPPMAHTHKRNPCWHYLRTAAISAIATTIVGSLLTVSALALFFGGDYSPADFVILWLVYIVYSGAVVLPVALLFGCPLMMLLRKQPSWVWILSSLAGGTVLGAIALLAVSHAIRLPALTLLAMYATLFGFVASMIQRMYKPILTEKEISNDPNTP